MISLRFIYLKRFQIFLDIPQDFLFINGILHFIPGPGFNLISIVIRNRLYKRYSISFLNGVLKSWNIFYIQFYFKMFYLIVKAKYIKNSLIKLQDCTIGPFLFIFFS